MKAPLLFIFILGAGSLRGETPTETATNLFNQKSYAEAHEAFERLAVAEPGNAEIHYYLGMLAERRADPAGAVTELELATSLAPTKSLYFLELGGAYGAMSHQARLLDKLDWARKCLRALEKAVERDPDSIPARNGLISFYREAPPVAGGGIDKAYEQASEIRKRDPIKGAVILAQLFISQHKYDEAFDTYETALTADPDNYQLLYLIGRAAADSGEHLDRGERAFRRCLQLPPGKDEQGYAAVHWRLGQIAEKRPDLAGARVEYESALREHPGFKAAADSLARLTEPPRP
jgi:tetratricopeptide (TPR) repeat protein